MVGKRRLVLLFPKGNQKLYITDCMIVQIPAVSAELGPSKLGK